MYPTINALLESTSRTRTRTRTLSEAEALEWLQTNAPKQLEQFKRGFRPPARWYNIKALWRGGSGGSGPFVLTDPSSAPPRSAANIGDLYRVLVDEANPDWPRRDQGIVGSTDEDTAAGYGRVRVMIPADSAVVAAVGRDDMWDLSVEIASSFLARLVRAVEIIVYTSHPDIEDEWGKLSKALVAPGAFRSGDRAPMSPDQWRASLGRLRDIIDLIIKDDPATREGLKREWHTWAKDAVRYMPPDRMDFGAIVEAFTTFAFGPDRSFDLIGALIPLYSYDRIPSMSKGPAVEMVETARGEVWTNAPCLLVDAAALQEMVTQLLGNDDPRPTDEA